jgi:hypothetical protein
VQRLTSLRASATSFFNLSKNLSKSLFIGNYLRYKYRLGTVHPR